MINDINSYAEELFAKYEQLKYIVPYARILKNPSFTKRVESLDVLQNIIIESLQLGNYTRAIKYLVVFESILTQLENKKIYIENGIVHYLHDS